jgi:endonuclease YncB( thermonuclease family)
MTRPYLPKLVALTGTILLIYVIGAILCLAPAETMAAEVSSYAFVQEDGSIRIKGRTYRLDGIHIPATDQTCRTFERPVKCSSQAALALDFKIGANFVRCVPRATNDDGSFKAYCTNSNGVDLAAYLLERGWAVALTGAPIEYTTLEKIARNKNLGVWGFAVHRKK